MKCKGNKTGGDWYTVNSDWDRMSPSAYLEFTEDWIEASKRVLTPSGTIFVCATYHNIGEVMVTLKKAGFRINNIITWYKNNVMPNMTRRTYTHSCEFIIWAALAPGWVFNYELMKEMNPDRKKDGSLKQMRDLWTFPLCQGKERLHRKDNGRALHPTQKPMALVERALLASTNPGDMVLDPFHGSGTTGVVSAIHGRRCIGIERAPEYFSASVERIEQLLETGFSV
jgi:site-specific DNA-methyltransferase (adenine-specific)/modification methylase